MMIYTMKTVTINKTKVKIFDEKEDLVEILGLFVDLLWINKNSESLKRQLKVS